MSPFLCMQFKALTHGLSFKIDRGMWDGKRKITRYRSCGQTDGIGVNFLAGQGCEIEA